MNVSLDLALLAHVIAAVEDEGVRLREEFYLPEGPRGRGGDAPIDAEMERRLCAKLQALLPAPFSGEETGDTPGTLEGWLWLVDPQDGTSDFLLGRRGSAISVALLRGSAPVLGVVHAPEAPDLGHDTIAWAEGAGPMQRNGKSIVTDLRERRLAAGELVWATAASASRPATFARAAAPARVVALPSIAYRLARIAAGDGIATFSVHGVNEYDVAAGVALIRAAGGVALDASGREIVFGESAGGRLSGCFAGAPQAAGVFAKFDWSALDNETRRPRRVELRYPRRDDPLRIARAQGCLLGQVIGDSLGSRVEFLDAAEIAANHPDGVRELADGGTFDTIAGQPTDDSELALALARVLVRTRAAPEAAGGGATHDAAPILEAYRAWLASGPFDCGMTTRRGIDGRPDRESQANGSLMRISPAGIFAAGDPARAARIARADAALTHPNPVCVEAAAGFAAALACGVAGGDPRAMLEAARAQARGPALEAIERGAAGEPPADFMTNQGWVLVALQNAFYRLLHAASLEQGLIATVGCGGDTDTNGAIAGALLGAAHGRAAVPLRWIHPVLACRALAEAGARHPRPADYWPDDVLELAEALLVAGGM